MTTLRNPAPGSARNPDKKITLEPFAGTVTVRAGDRVIATSGKAVKLSETFHEPVLYIPFEDVDFAFLEKSATSSHCPYKGDATYWSVKNGPKDAMWTYEAPFDEVAEIRSHGAFYANRVEIRIVEG